MPALASLTVNDGETTPLAHTFVPVAVDNGIARLKNSDGTPIGDEIITISLRETPQKYKGRLVLTVPTMVTETINGVSVPRVDRSIIVDVNVACDKTSSTQERDNALAMAGNLLVGGVTLVDGVFRDLEGVW